jgi:hypothetical protein
LYFPNFIARRYFIVIGVNGIPHLQRIYIRISYSSAFLDSTRSTLQSSEIAYSTYINHLEGDLHSSGDVVGKSLTVARQLLFLGIKDVDRR